jgi:hypothetical protein
MSASNVLMLMYLFLATAVSAPAALAQTTAKPPARPPATPAAAPAPSVVAGFKGTAANLERVAGETITIDIRRWSTDEEKSKLAAAFAQGAQQAGDSMQKLESVGYIWRSGSGLGHSIRYAFDTKLPDGRQRVILVTGDNLSEWNRRPGPAPAEAAPPVTVFELRLPASGSGEGKISSKVAADATSQLLVIDGYDSAPVVLREVTRAKR